MSLRSVYGIKGRRSRQQRWQYLYSGRLGENSAPQPAHVARPCVSTVPIRRSARPPQPEQLPKFEIIKKTDILRFVLCKTQRRIDIPAVAGCRSADFLAECAGPCYCVADNGAEYMSEYSVITNPIEFRDQFLSQLQYSCLDEAQQVALRVSLYYVWRGLFHSRAALALNLVKEGVGILCFSTFKALLPIIQLIRLGHFSAAMILLRALWERIALLGYLEQNPDQIERYMADEAKVLKFARKWASSDSPANWMQLYGFLSKVAHPHLDGTAANILDGNPMTHAFRKDLHQPSGEQPSLSNELLAFVLYSLMAIDPIAVNLLHKRQMLPMLQDSELMLYVSPEDLRTFQSYVTDLVSLAGIQLD